MLHRDRDEREFMHDDLTEYHSLLTPPERQEYYWCSTHGIDRTGPFYTCLLDQDFEAFNLTTTARQKPRPTTDDVAPDDVAPGDVYFQAVAHSIGNDDHMMNGKDGNE